MKKPTSWLVALVAGSSLVVSAAASAQQPDERKKDSKEERKDQEESARPKPVEETVVVTATRGERRLDDLPVSATVLDRKRIETAPVLTTNDLLRDVPSLNFPLLDSAFQHPTSDFLSIRGLGGPRVLVMLDGVPVNDPFFGFVQWEKVPPETLDRVEVVRGGASALFGTYALGGAINLLTRPVAETNLAAEVQYGTLDTVRANAYGGWRGSDRLSVTGNLNYFKTGGYVEIAPEERSATDIKTAGKSINGQLKLGYDATPSLRTYFRSNYFYNDQDLQTRFSRNDRHVLDLAGGAHWVPRPDTEVSANVFYERDRFRTDNTDYVDPNSHAVDYVSNIHETPARDLGGSVQWSKSFHGALRELLIGADVRSIAGEDRGRIFDPSGALVLIQNGKGKQTSAGLFAQTSLSPSGRLEILLSARLDYWKNFEGAEIEIPGTITPTPDKSFTQIDPRLAARYQLSEELALRGAVYRAFRAPNLDNLYRPFTAAGFAGLPNSQLDPETLVGGEAGVEYVRGRFRGQLNLFQNEIRDLIGSTVVSFSPVFTVKEINIGKTRSRGVEILLDYGFGSDWAVTGGYTYTDSIVLENPDDPTLVGTQNAGVPKHAATLGVSYHRASGLGASLRVRYLSDQIEEFSFGQLDAHTLVDAFVSYPVLPQVELLVIGSNLFDEKYVASAFGGTQLGPPRQVFGGIRVRL